jgi:hypothetical protein
MPTARVNGVSLYSEEGGSGRRARAPGGTLTM